VDAVNIPVIAAGGIADGRGAAAAVSLGASGIQMGTRFLASEESEIHETFKNAVLKANDIDTVVTGELLGNRARVLKTKMAKRFIKQERFEMSKPKPDAQAIEDLENGSLRRAVIDGNKDEGAFMAGQISGMIQTIKPVSDILADTWSEASVILTKYQLKDKT
jgi:enoyl-[acyl-carrier protein] reductase II